MSFEWAPDQLSYARSHLWAILATGRLDGSPQQSMVGYFVDDDGRLVISAETIADDPLRSELTAQVFATLSGGDAPDPDSIVPMLDEQQRTIIRITPEKTLFQD